MIEDYGDDELSKKYIENYNSDITYGYWEKIVYKENKNFKTYYMLLPYYKDNTWTGDKLIFHFKRQMVYFGKIAHIKLLEKP